MRSLLAFSRLESWHAAHRFAIRGQPFKEVSTQAEIFEVAPLRASRSDAVADLIVQASNRLRLSTLQNG